MIVVDGKQYKTLDEKLYGNGKLIKDVWSWDRKHIYPETVWNGYGQIVKFRGYMEHLVESEPFKYLIDDCAVTVGRRNECSIRVTFAGILSTGVGDGSFPNGGTQEERDAVIREGGRLYWKNYVNDFQTILEGWYNDDVISALDVGFNPLLSLGDQSGIIIYRKSPIPIATLQLIVKIDESSLQKPSSIKLEDTIWSIPTVADPTLQPFSTNAEFTISNISSFSLGWDNAINLAPNSINGITWLGPDGNTYINNGKIISTNGNWYMPPMQPVSPAYLIIRPWVGFVDQDLYSSDVAQPWGERINVYISDSDYYVDESMGLKGIWVCYDTTYVNYVGDVEGVGRQVVTAKPEGLWARVPITEILETGYIGNDITLSESDLYW